VAEKGWKAPATIVAIAGVLIAALALVYQVTAGGDKPPPPPTPGPGEPVSEIPSDYQGDWYGTVQNVYAGAVDVYLHIGPGTVDEVVGTLDLTDCSGNVTYHSGTGPIDLTFRPTSNPQSICNPTAALRVSLLDAEQLRFISLSGGQTTSDGTLRRG
jgi:hypothetical protein